jgi:hypothetical protein
MPVENPRPVSEEEAHDEANMLRTKIGVSPKSGKVEEPDMRQDREPTAEDYDRALAAVDELKRIAEEEPNGLKLLEKANSAVDSLLKIPTFGVLFLTRVSHSLIGPEPGGPKERWKRNAGITDLIAEFDDAKGQLQTLKAKGTQFGKKEIQREAA